MNKQLIEQLVKQSRVEYSNEMGETYWDFSKEKFAELIVRECISVMSKTAKKAQDNLTYMGDDVPTFSHQCAIMNHFGVE